MGGRFSIRKLFQNLLVIGCLVVAGWVGYQLFVPHSLDPVIGSIIFIVDIGVLIWNVVVLRGYYYKGKHPSFKLVLLLLLVVVLILAFVGIEPLSSYKDSIVDQVTNTIKEQLGNNHPLNIVVSNTRIMWMNTFLVFIDLSYCIEVFKYLG